MSVLKKSALLIVICCMHLSVFAQKNAPTKFGKIPEADLKMTVYDLDSSANAVVLFDKGEIAFDISPSDGAIYRFARHRRVKLLKKAGFEEADFSIYHHKSQDVSRIKAQVFSPDGEKTTLGKDDIFEEEVIDDVYSKKLAFPNLEEGAVVEYKYEISSKNLTSLRDWYFQEDIPVRWSELYVEMPEWFKYLTFFQGKDMLTKSEQDNKVTSIGGQSVQVTTDHFVMENVPALKEEPYITTMDDYLARIQFQLRSVQLPYQTTQFFLKNWPAFAKDLMEDEDFGLQFTRKRYVKTITDKTAAVVADAKTDKEKIEALYNHLAKELEWDGHNSYWAFKNVDRIYENKTGNSAELNFVLLAALKGHGITAYPLLVSTRDHGRPNTTYPLYDQFNHMLVLAQAGDENILLDVSEKNRPVGYPNINSLNYEAWLVDEEIAQWIQMVPPQTKEVIYGQFNLSESGELDGFIKCSHGGYSAVKERDHLDARPNGEFWQDRIGDRFASADVKNVAFTNQQKVSAPLKNQVDMSITDAAQVNGDFIYLSPVVYNRFDENPFKLQKRSFPVEFAYPFDEHYIFNCTVPDGFILEEAPDPVRISLPNGGGSFTYSASLKGNNLQVVSKISLKQLMFSPQEYDTIKHFFDLIIEKQQMQLVLKKQSN